MPPATSIGSSSKGTPLPVRTAVSDFLSNLGHSNTIASDHRSWLAWWRDPALTALLVLLSLQVFVGEPLSGTHLPEAPGLAVIWFLLIVSAVLVAAQNRATIAAILLASIIALIANILRLKEPSTLTICVGSGSLIVFLAALSCVVWKAVFGPGLVTHHRIRGAVVLYLSIALSFAALYEILLTLVPNSLSGVVPKENYLVLSRGLIYYSFTTITSTGYGDVLPTHPLARSVANLEALIGQLFPAMLLARIVALELQGRRRTSDGAYSPGTAEANVREPQREAGSFTRYAVKKKADSRCTQVAGNFRG